MIIFSSTRYHDGDLGSVLQCGDMVPKVIEETGVFKPKYYILAEHTGNHYKLVTYKGKKNFRFHEIPHGIKKLIQEKGDIVADLRRSVKTKRGLFDIKINGSNSLFIQSIKNLISNITAFIV